MNYLRHYVKLMRKAQLRVLSEMEITSKELCEKYNLSGGTLSMVIHGKRKQHNGWVVLESSETTDGGKVQPDNFRKSAEPG